MYAVYLGYIDVQLTPDDCANSQFELHTSGRVWQFPPSKNLPEMISHPCIAGDGDALNAMHSHMHHFCIS
jgi:hypothetical protein